MSETPEPEDIVGSEEPGLLAPQCTFLVRVRRNASGAITGVVEVVRTGEKRPFEGVGAIGAVIDALFAPSAAAPPPDREAR